MLKIALVTLFGMILSAGAFEILREGRPACVLALPENATELERKAAEELKYFLDQSSGCSFAVIPETKAEGPAIYLGWSEYARKAGLDYASADREEWILRSDAHNLCITGGRPAGTLYGVYEFLEKLGFYFLSKDCTVFPETLPATLDPLDERKKPAFPGRNVFDLFSWPAFVTGVPQERHQAHWLYRLRSRLNGGHGIARKDFPDALYLGFPFNLTMSYHTLSYYVDPKLFAEHPEYFAMDENGLRHPPRSFTAQGSPCLSNRAVWDVALESLRGYIKRDRKDLPQEKWPILYDISSLDNTPYFCKCPDCQKIVDREGGDAGLILPFINYIAEKIRHEYPDILIRTFAYSSARDVPRTVRPAQNVIIQVCDEFPQSECYRALSHPFNQENLAMLQAWSDTGAQLALWDYWNMGGSFFNPPRIETITESLQEDLRTFRKLNFISLFLEAERDQIVPQNFIDLNYFLAAQLMLDPDKNQKDLIDLFMRGFYGPAAPQMREYLEILRRGIRNQPNKQRTMRVGRWQFITPEFLMQSLQMFEQALLIVPEGSPYRFRVQNEMLPLLWQMLQARHELEIPMKTASIRFSDIQEQCRKFSLEYLHREQPKNPKRYLEEFEERFAALTAHMPVPERFRNIPPEDIRIYGYPYFRPMKHVGSDIVEDPEAVSGKALSSFHEDPTRHGLQTMYVDDSKNFRCRASKFAVACLDREQESSIVIETVPDDEKYHWYCIPNAEISGKTLLWGHLWALQFELSQAYMVTDGLSNANLWDCWFSLKFTGPAYIPGSQKPNSVNLDQVVLVRPQP